MARDCAPRWLGNMEQHQLIGDRYEMLDPIGRGGMATIFRARDTRMGRMVAVKILREMYSSDPKFVLRFQREARAVSALSHPNIVQVFDYGRNNDEYYIVMELVEGTDLRRYLKTHGILDLRRAVVIAHDVALALGAAHQRGIVHRDVKPQNILVNDQALVKLTDFGIATFYRDMDNERLTTTGMTLGTVQYYAPEQAQGDVVTPAADVYSLGVVMYEMLVGHPPFDGDTPVAIAVRHIQEPPARPSRFNPNIPPALERIILRCLEKDPRDRYRDGDALAYALETFDKPRTPSGRIDAAGLNPMQPMGSARLDSGPRRPPSGPRNGGPAYYDDSDYLPGGGFNQNPTRAEAAAGTMAGPGIMPPEEGEDEAASPTAGVTTAIIVASVLLLLAVSCFLAFKLGLGSMFNHSTIGGNTVAVPDFTGKTLAQAQTVAASEHLTLHPNYSASDKPINLIFNQNPSPAVVVPLNTVVEVDISLGPHPDEVQVPNVAGESFNQACIDLRKVKLDCNQSPTYWPASSSNYLPGEVDHTDPPIASLQPLGTQVTLFIVQGVTPTAQTTSTPSAKPTPTPSGTTPTPSGTTPTPTNTPTQVPINTPTPSGPTPTP